MIFVFAILAIALFVPLLVVAIALGPVILGILCAVGCALLVAAAVNVVLGVGVLGRSLERAGIRLARHRHPQG